MNQTPPDPREKMVMPPEAPTFEPTQPATPSGYAEHLRQLEKEIMRGLGIPARILLDGEATFSIANGEVKAVDPTQLQTPSRAKGIE